jgi:uncharacterized NAD(P)/FAD-binding protein YdhS
VRERDIVEPREYDLVFVGAGASTSYVLMALLEALREGPPSEPLRIGVVERSPDPFTGVPYGGRAARTSLLITALRDFLPGPERALFVEWLGANKDWVFDEFLSAPGTFSARWWSRHEAEIRDEELDALFLPRYTFGEYLARRTRAAIRRAEEAGVAATEVLCDDVVSIDPSPHAHLITCVERTISARRVVLAIGSPPVLPRLQQDIGRPGAVLVDDPFDSMGAALEGIRKALDERPEGRPPHVVVIGANAGTMDMLYQVNDMTGRGSVEATFTVLSPSGQLPERVDALHDPTPFRAERLESLQQSDTVDAFSIYRAALDDIARGRAARLSVADTLPPISQGVGRLLHRLSPDQAAEFADRWGLELGRHQRRAGWEYCEVVEHLAASERLELVAGCFVDVVADERDEVHVRYTKDGVLSALPRPVDAVINCAGPARSLEQWAPPLLAQLIASGICRLTPSGGGIAVDSTLAAAPDLYVMGPLLAGNVVKGSPVWHMEHCGRISTFGSALGVDLARTLVTSAG